MRGDRKRQLPMLRDSCFARVASARVRAGGPSAPEHRGNVCVAHTRREADEAGWGRRRKGAPRSVGSSWEELWRQMVDVGDSGRGWDVHMSVSAEEGRELLE